MHRDATKHGIDISKSRLDDIDREVLRFALCYKGKKVAVDIGCGYGRVSIILALMGFDIYLIDIQDLSEYFKRVGEALDISDKLHFIHKDISEIRGEDLPTDIVIAISQRTLHHVQYADAQHILKLVHNKMINGGKLFLSLSGIESKLAEVYKCADSPVAERFCEVGEVGKRVYSINGKVCLYNQQEAGEMVKRAGLELSRVYKSAFGNIKLIASKV